VGAGLISTVSALAVSGTDVYAGGAFWMAGGVLASYIAKWDGGNWTALGSGTRRGMNNTVSALATLGTDLYAGGCFTMAAEITANGIAKWNGSGWSPLGSAVNGCVAALAVSGSDLYAGGNFITAGGVPANNIAKWDGASWRQLSSGMNGGVSALAVSGSDLYAAGTFTTADGKPANYIAKWNGNSWTSLGSGIAGAFPALTYVSALSVLGNDLYAGGGFTTAGGKVSAYVARAYLLPLPALSVLPSGRDVLLSWPSANTADFSLEQASALVSRASWSANIAGVTDDGTNKSVRISATNGASLFRLRRP
jgi:hypothetical protein